jgi:hypothetical protein
MNKQMDNFFRLFLCRQQFDVSAASFANYPFAARHRYMDF